MEAFDCGIGRVHPLQAGPEDWGSLSSITDYADCILPGVEQNPAYDLRGMVTDGSAFMVRQPSGVVDSCYAVLPHLACVPAAGPRMSTILEDYIERAAAAATLKSQFVGITAADAPEHLRKWRVYLKKYMMVESKDDVLDRILPRIDEIRDEGNHVTPFIKLWLYFFAAWQGHALGAGARFAPVDPSPVIIEDSKVAHVEWDVAQGDEDGTVLDPKPTLDRCRYWRAAVRAFPAFTYTDAEETTTPTALMVDIRGGTLRYCGPGMTVAWAEWAAMPTPREWLVFIRDAATMLDCQDDALAAFYLASNLAFAARDPTPYRQPPAAPGGQPYIASLLVTAAAQLRGIPLPAVDLARTRWLPLIEPGGSEHPLNRLTRFNPAGLIRVGMLWALELAYGLKHAMYAFGLSGRRLLDLNPNGLGNQARITLLQADLGLLAEHRPALVMCASHIMKHCFGSMVPIEVAKYLAPANDSSATDGEVNISDIYGCEPPGWVRTLHLIHRMRDVPATCGYYVYGSAPDAGDDMMDDIITARSWPADPVPRPRMRVSARTQMWANAIDDARRMMSAVAYANSTRTPGAANESNVAACSRFGFGWMDARNHELVMDSEWDLDVFRCEGSVSDILDVFRREGSVPILGLKDGVRWGYSVRCADPGSDFTTAGGGVPALWVGVMNEWRPLPAARPPATTLETLQALAAEPREGRGQPGMHLYPEATHENVGMPRAQWQTQRWLSRNQNSHSNQYSVTISGVSSQNSHSIQNSVTISSGVSIF